METLSIEQRNIFRQTSKVLVEEAEEVNFDDCWMHALQTERELRESKKPDEGRKPGETEEKGPGAAWPVRCCFRATGDDTEDYPDGSLYRVIGPVI